MEELGLLEHLFLVVLLDRGVERLERMLKLQLP